jgi:aminopeptidase N
MESVHNERSRGWSAGQWSWINQQFAAENADRNIARPLVQGEKPGTDPIQLFFSGHIYPKGAQVAHQLRRLLGDSVFWAGMRRFLTDNAYKPVETADFAVAMEKASGRDLDWFFDQWAYGIGYPKVKVERKYDAATKALTITVSQSQPIDSTRPFFRFPATVRIITRDSVVRHEIMVTEQQQHFVLPLPGAPVTFRFDEGGWLLGQVQTDQTPAELAELAKHDLEFAARFWALSALDSSSADAARDARRFIALNDADEIMRSEAIRQIAEYDGATSRDLVVAGLGDPSSNVRGRAIVALAKLDSVGAQPEIVRLITTDPSFFVQMQALGVYDPTRSPQGTALLIDRTQHGGALSVRTAAAERLGLFPDEAGIAAIEAMTANDEPRNARSEALNVLASLRDKSRAIAVASRYLSDGDPLFASQAVRTLARVGGEAGRATLTAALTKETRVTVRATITQALAPKQ